MLLENLAPHQGWYRFVSRSDKFITGLTSNLHKWKRKFFFAEGEWASEFDRDMVPTQWGTVPNTKLAPLTLAVVQERLLEKVRNNPMKEASEIMLAASLSTTLSRSKKNGPPIDRSIVDEVFTSEVPPIPPPLSKRAKSSAPNSSQLGSTGQASFSEAELGDVPPSSLIDVSSPPRDCSSTITGVEVLAPSSVRIVDPPSYSTTDVPSVSMLRNLSLARGRLCDFMSGAEAQDVASRGPEGMVNAVVEGFALMAAALSDLFNNTLKIGEQSVAKRRRGRHVRLLRSSLGLSGRLKRMSRG